MTRLPSLGPRGEGWVIVQLLLLALVALSGPATGPTWGAPLASVTALVGAVLILGGGVLAVRGLFDLGRNLTPTPRPRDDAVLVEHGAYARVRHPVYGGLVLASFGWGLVSASLVTLALAGLLAVVLDLKSRREEAWLQERYPGYAAYATRTRRLVPWLY